MNIRSRFSLYIVAICLVGTAACEPANIVEAPPEEAAKAQQAAQLEQAPKAEAAKQAGNRLDAKKLKPQVALSPSAMKQLRERVRKAPRCPMAVPGTTPTAVRLDGAGAIDFTTDKDVAELRRQVQKKVLIHQENHIDPGQLKPIPAAVLQRMTAAQRMQAEKRHEIKRLMGTSTVVGEEIDGGMRVKLTPADPTEMDALFVIIQDHADGLKAAGPICPNERQRGHVPQRR